MFVRDCEEGELVGSVVCVVWMVIDFGVVYDGFRDYGGDLVVVF